MRPIVFVLTCLILSGNLATSAKAIVLDKMDDANNFYMYDAKQTGLTRTHQMPGYIVLTKAEDGENFIRWSNPDKRPVRLGQYDTVEIDFADFGSSTKVQILVEYFKNGHGGKGLSGVKTLIKGFNTRQKQTLKFNLVTFAKANGITGEYDGFRLMFRHMGNTNTNNTIKLDEIRLTDSKLTEAAKAYQPNIDPPSPFMYGVGSHMSRQFSGRTPWQVGEIIEQSGFSFVRDSILWRDVERKKGVLKIPEHTERMVKIYEDKGIEPLILLLYGNKLYDQNKTLPTESSIIEGYIRYAEFVVRHYKGRIKYYEIWNEWDKALGYPRQANGKRPEGDPVDYANFVKAVYPRLKAIDPDAIFLAGGHCAQSLQRTDWFERSLAAGLVQYCDGLAMHTYTRPYDNPEYWHQWVTEMNIRFSEQYNDGKPLPFYITETGWYTKTDANVDYYVQAQYLARMYLLAKTRPFIRGIWYFTVSGMDQFEMSKLYMPLPAMVAAHDIKDVVENGKYLGRVQTDDPSIWVLRFAMPDGVEKWAVWSETPFEFKQTKWTSDTIGFATLHLKNNIASGQPQSMKIKQIGGMTFTRSWGLRPQTGSSDFDFTVMNLPIGPMPIIIEADFEHIQIKGVTPAVNKKTPSDTDQHNKDLPEEL